MALRNDNENKMSPSQPLDYPEEFKQKARAFFAKGAETAYTLNYDYAIELYLDGLSFWPDALEDGHLKLWDIALRRQAAGGKKSGFSDGSKYKKASGKNDKDAMLKAEYLLAKEPSNLTYMADMLKASVSGGFQKTSQWIADILFDRNRQQDKPAFSIYILLRDKYIEMNNYHRALQACQMAAQLKPKDENLQGELRDLSAQATMQQGKYDGEGDFRDSIKNREQQEKLQSQENLIQSDDKKGDAISEARAEYQADPLVPGKIFKLVDALCATEKAENEKEAIQILEDAFQKTSQFQFKQRSGDIQVKQWNRYIRILRGRLQQSPDDPALPEQIQNAQKKCLLSELEHYRLCVENYPTDMKFQSEYGKRLFRARKFEEAIPVFQKTGNDPRYRIESLKFIGQCFYYMQWYPDAVSSFQQALENHSSDDDDIAKELRYNLGRAFEADNKLQDALESYRKVAQVDFNYHDVRNRVENLRKKISSQP